MKTNIDISFVIVNYNGYEDTVELLNSMYAFFKSDYTFEIIVVDNGSYIDKTQNLLVLFPNISLIKSFTNLGFSGGYNLGINEASGRYIMLINNDTLFTDSSVFELVSFMDKTPKAGAVSPKIYFFEPKNTIQYAGFTDLSKITLRNRAIGYGELDEGQYDNVCKTAFTHGAAMLVRRETFEKAGKLPDIFFLYYEELDWCYRARRAGYEMWYCPLSTIIHKESKSNSGRFNYSKQFYMSRNRFLLAKRNRKGFAKIASYTYLLFVASLKDVVKATINGKWLAAKAILAGTIAFIKMKRK